MADPNPGLQFDHAEFEGNAPASATCTSCQKPLADTYYEVGGQVTCESCKRQIESSWDQSSDFGARVGRLLRAAIFGTLAGAAGCGLYYLVLALTGWQVGLISILVGWMVGGAVRAGARRRGGWLYQGLAMFLTYTAIVFSYVPIILKEAQAAQTMSEVQQSGPIAIVIMAILAIPFLYVLPFLMLAEDPGSLISILIIAFGVYEAWKMNKKEQLQVTGPYSLAARAAEPVPAPIQP
jgi:hypothetical protein